MRARWGAALAAAALAASAGARAADGGTCELSRVNREATTTRGCLSCHDGSAGPGVGFKMGADDRAMSHPVEVDYAAAAAAHPGQYQPAAALPPEVPLVGGKVQCTTCHDGASPDRKRVVAVRDLCVTCHRL
jgi:predicted CXXCH cytochrome family protein